MLAPLLATLIASASPSAALTVADFFPLVPGTKRFYEEKAVTQMTSEDEVLAPVEINGQKAYPVATRVGGKVISTTLYRIDGDTLWILGTDPKALLPRPMPVFSLTGDKGVWSFDGAASAAKDTEPMSTSGESRLKGEKEVFGKKIPILEVRLKATVGGGNAKERIEQVATYGKGVGLIEAITKTSVGRKVVTSTVRLTRIEEAKSSG